MNQAFSTLKMLANTGTKFDFWEIRSYCAPNGDDILFNEEGEIGGVCVVCESESGESYAEWIFDLTGDLVQFAVWDHQTFQETL